MSVDEESSRLQLKLWAGRRASPFLGEMLAERNGTLAVNTYLTPSKVPLYLTLARRPSGLLEFLCSEEANSPTTGRTQVQASSIRRPTSSEKLSLEALRMIDRIEGQMYSDRPQVLPQLSHAR